MKVINYIKLEIPSISANESYSRVAVSSFLAQLNPDVERLAEVKTAISEAVTNCIVHAYPQSSGKIYIKVSIFDTGLVRITIKDKGIGIADVDKAMEPMFTTAPDDERAGLGFAVMETFMDKLRVSSRLEKGTTVVMEKKFSIPDQHI